MKKLRTYALAAASAALIAGAAVPATGAPAAAGDDTYAAEATATALRLSLFGQELTVGNATADVTSPDSANASGTGALIVTQGFGASEASATGVGSSDGSTTPTCSPLVLPVAVPLLDLSVACSSAIAGVTADGPSSSATGESFDLALSGDQILAPVVDALPLDEVTGTLLGGLGPLLGVLTPVPPELIADQLADLLGDTLVGDVELLSVSAGDAEAHTSADADSVDASTLSTGATIELLDRGSLLGGPILTIEVGESTTTVSRDRASGETTAEYSAIPVRVTVAPDLALLLSLPESTFEVPQGTQVDLPLPAPLTSSIILSGGSTEEIEGGALAEAATVQINLLGGVNGGVQLGLSSGSASVVGQAAAVEPPTPTTAPAAPNPTAPAPGARTPAPARTSLPRTGAEEQPMQLIALVLAVSAAGIGGLVVRSSRRSRTSKA